MNDNRHEMWIAAMIILNDFYDYTGNETIEHPYPIVSR